MTPSLSVVAVQVPRVLWLWCRRSLANRLAMAVGPAGHGRLWSTSHRCAAVVQPGAVHTPSSAATVLAMAAVGRYR